MKKIDALDRFGTKIRTKIYKKKEILIMMNDCGLINIEFSKNFHIWVAVGEKIN